MASSMINDENAIDLIGNILSYSDNSLSKKASSVSYSWPTGDEDEDEAAEKIYTFFQCKVDAHSEAYRRFHRTPASKLPLLFHINPKILSSKHAVQTTTSPLLGLPQELLFIIMPLLDGADAACLACTCKHLAAISQSFAITNTREYFVRRGQLSPDTDMCNRCHKNRPTMAKFWHRETYIIREWLDHCVDDDEDEYPYLDVIEAGIGRWTTPQAKEACGAGEQQRRLVFDDASNDAGDLATESRKVASEKRAFIKCPTCCAQDFYELMLLGLLFHEYRLDGALFEKVLKLVERPKSLLMTEMTRQTETKRRFRHL